MVRRVLLNATGLKLSKPAVDVVMASASQLDFSSDQASAGVYLTGAYTIPWTQNGQSGYFDGTISFGRTFPSQPLVFFRQLVNGGARPMGNAAGFSFSLLDNSLAGQTRWCEVMGKVTTTGITLIGRYNKQTSGWPMPALTFDYTVMHYNL